MEITRLITSALNDNQAIYEKRYKKRLEKMKRDIPVNV